jgi:hypothetical protein
MFRKRIVITLVAGTALAAFPAFSQDEISRHEP